MVEQAYDRLGLRQEPSPVRRAVYEEVDLRLRAAGEVVEVAEPYLARGTGAVQTIGGLAEAGTGVVVIVVSEGFGVAPGTVFVVHGLDVAQAGGRQMWTGRFTPTETCSVIAEAGYPTLGFVTDVGVALGSGYSALSLASGSAAPLRTLTPLRVARSEAGAVPSVLSRVERSYQRAMVVVFDAKPGEFIVSSGLSPGPVGGRRIGEQLLFPFAESSVARGVLKAGDARAYSELVARGLIDDALTPHHMPQAALGFTSRARGGALAIPNELHIRTRTYGARGAVTAQEEADLTFRVALARDINDIRRQKHYNHYTLAFKGNGYVIYEREKDTQA